MGQTVCEGRKSLLVCLSLTVDTCPSVHVCVFVTSLPPVDLVGGRGPVCVPLSPGGRGKGSDPLHPPLPEHAGTEPQQH